MEHKTDKNLNVSHRFYKVLSASKDGKSLLMIDAEDYYESGLTKQSWFHGFPIYSAGRSTLTEFHELYHE